VRNFGLDRLPQSIHDEPLSQRRTLGLAAKDVADLSCRIGLRQRLFQFVDFLAVWLGEIRMNPKCRRLWPVTDTISSSVPPARPKPSRIGPPEISDTHLDAAAGCRPDFGGALR